MACVQQAIRLKLTSFDSPADSRQMLWNVEDPACTLSGLSVICVDESSGVNVCLSWESYNITFGQGLDTCCKL